MSKAESKWDKIYGAREPNRKSRVDESLLKVRDHLPKKGAALDIAGGDGRNSVWLAKNGFDVTLIDVSSEALKLASELASLSGVSIETVKRDLELTEPTEGPWDLIIIFNYCEKALYKKVGGLLRPGGVLVVSQATIKNLERNPSPSSRFLIHDDELTALLPDLELLYRDASWRKNGRHEITHVAKKPI